MASASAIKAGQAFVEVSLRDGVSKALGKIQHRLTAFGSMVTRIGQIGFGAGAAGVALFAPTIAAAGDAAETMNKFNAVFGDQSQQAGDFADDLAKRIGRSAVDIKDSMSAFQAMFRGLDFDPSSAREMSQAVQALALDMASFYNLSDDEAVSRVRSALSGSAEVLDQFGINTKVSALNQEFQRQDPNLNNNNATEQQKVQARIAIIQRAMQNQGAVGDAEATSGSFTNQMKRLGAAVTDAKVAIGEGLLPIVTPLVTQLSAAAQMAAGWLKENKPLVASLFKLAAGVAAGGAAFLVLGQAAGAGAGMLGLMIKGVGLVTAGVGGLIGLVGTAASAFTLLASPIGLVVGGLTVAVASLADFEGVGTRVVGTLKTLFGDLKATAFETFAGVKDALAAGDWELAGKTLWTGLKVAWEMGVTSLKDIWFSLSAPIFDAATDLWTGVVSIVNNAFRQIEKRWVEFKDFAADSGAVIGNTVLDIATLGIGSEGRNEAMYQGISEREQNRRKRLAEIDASQKRETDAIRGNGEAIKARREAERQASRDAAAERIEALKAESRELRKQAAEAAKAVRSSDQAAGMPGGKGENRVGGVLGLMPEAAKAAEQSAKAIQMRRQNLAVELGTGEGNKVILDALLGRENRPELEAMKKTAANTKKAADKLDKIEKNGKNAIPVKLEDA